IFRLLCAMFKVTHPLMTPFHVKTDLSETFSSKILIFIFCLKPLNDALYAYEISKYMYLAILLGAAFFAFVGNRLRISELDKRQDNHWLIYSFGVIGYACFLGLLIVFKNGSVVDLIKKVSPFLVLILMGSIYKGNALNAIKWMALLVLVSNFLLLPVGYGWVEWGSVRTFKGFFYFKTDLAFSVCMALFVFFVANDKKIDWKFLGLAAMTAIMVLLSNSRLNYLLLFIIMFYVMLSAGYSFATLIRAAVLISVAALIFLLLYDSSKFLSFDMSNEERFTQGRNRIWAVIIDHGIAKATFSEWMFGQGLIADWLLSHYYGALDKVHDAHNEVLHLLMNQGLVGLFSYFFLWFFGFKILGWKTMSRESKIILGLGCGMLLIQSMTTVLSSYFLKTWWMVVVALLAKWKTDALVKTAS
ncbi:MAG: O-antigen ligase family protein, partial [Pseudomonadota bacterium]